MPCTKTLNTMWIILLLYPNLIVTPLLAFPSSLKNLGTQSASKLYEKKNTDELNIDYHQKHHRHNVKKSLDESKGIYIHIPYCRRRCKYCDFAIVPIGDQYKNERAMTGFERMDESYRKCITTEIDLLIGSLKKNNTAGSEQEKDRIIKLSSVYFGGGTPSLAPLQTIQSIFDHIFSSDSVFELDKDAEITIEMDPGTFTEEHLRALKKIGFNRISLGVQSFNDGILECIGRVHRSEDIDYAIECIKNVFGATANYSVDLISGLPGLTLESWVQTIETALSLEPPPNHLSIYDLQIEEGTVFGKMYPDSDEDEDEDEDDTDSEEKYRTITDMTATSSGANFDLFSLPSSGDCASMYRHASEYLRSNGFEHYEISSYARLKKDQNSSFRSRHNQIYWRIDSEWYAVGLSATSSIQNKRFARPRLLADYNKWVSKLCCNDNNNNQIISGKEKEQKYDWFPLSHNNHDEDDSLNEVQLLDVIMTRLRTKEGLDLNWIAAQQDGDNLLKAVLRGANMQPELIRIEKKDKDEKKEQKKDKGILRLTDPDGFLFSNYVISSIFAELP